MDSGPQQPPPTRGRAESDPKRRARGFSRTETWRKLAQPQFSFLLKDETTLRIEAEVDAVSFAYYRWAGFIAAMPRLWCCVSVTLMLVMAGLGGYVGGLDTINLNNPERGMGARGTALAGRLYATYYHLQVAICHGDLSLNPDGYPSPFVYWDLAFDGDATYGYCTDDDRRRLAAAPPSPSLSELVTSPTAWGAHTFPRADLVFAGLAEAGVAAEAAETAAEEQAVAHRVLYDGITGSGSRLDYQDACIGYTRSERLAVVFEDLQSSRTLLRADALVAMCQIQEDIESKYGFQDTCTEYEVLDEDSPSTAAVGDCCPPRSVAQYMADWSGVSCTALTDTEVAYGLDLLQECVAWYRNETMFDCMAYASSTACALLPNRCNNVTVYDSLNALLPVDAVDDNLQSPVRLLKQEVVNRDADWLYDIHDKYLRPQYLDKKCKYGGGIRLSSYYTHTKYDAFAKEIEDDLIFAGVAYIVVFLLILAHSEYFVFTILAFLQIMSSLGVGFTVYTQILRLQFFPALNLVAVFIVSGIGADDIFVFVDHWNQSFEELLPEAPTQLRLAWVFQHAGTAMLITSITTSVAFLASMFSPITAISLFGLYCGIVVITDYFLNMIVIPAVILCFLQPRWVQYANMYPIGSCARAQELGKEANWQAGTRAPALCTRCGEWVRNRTGGGAADAVDAEEADTGSVGEEQTPAPMLVKMVASTLGSRRELHQGRQGSMRRKIGDLFSLKVTRRRHKLKAWILTIFGVTAWFCYVGSTLEWNDSQRFPVFKPWHPMEVFDQVDRDKFYQDGVEGTFRWSVLLFWGMKPRDNGNALDPDDGGSLVREKTPSISSKPAQQWLWDLCADAEEQGWYRNDPSEHCFIKDLKTWVDFPCENTTDSLGWVDDDEGTSEWVQYPARTDCCRNTTLYPDNATLTFPYDPDFFDACLVDFTGAWTDPTTPSLFDLEVAKHLVFFDAQGNVDVLGIEIPTNVDFTTTYQDASDFFEKIDAWFNKQMKSAPSGTNLDEGFFTSNLWFFAVQDALAQGAWQATLSSVGLAAMVLCFMTADFQVAALAGITILVITAWLTGILITLDWTLGPVESIIFSVAVGMAVDFVSHVSHAFVHVELPEATPDHLHETTVFGGEGDPEFWTPFVKRHYRAMVALMRMLTSITFAMSTTLISGAFMYLFCNTIFFYQFGQFMVYVMILSWGLSVFFLVPLLMLFGPAEPLSHADLWRETRRASLASLAALSADGGPVQASFSFFSRRSTVAGTNAMAGNADGPPRSTWRNVGVFKSWRRPQDDEGKEAGGVQMPAMHSASRNRPLSLIVSESESGSQRTLSDIAGSDVGSSATSTVSRSVAQLRLTSDAEEELASPRQRLPSSNEAPPHDPRFESWL